MHRSGSRGIYPVITSRSLVQHPEDVLSKYSRWRTILKEAAEQSGRGSSRICLSHAAFQDILVTIPTAYPLCPDPWEDEHRSGLRDLLSETATEKNRRDHWSGGMGSPALKLNRQPRQGSNPSHWESEFCAWKQRQWWLPRLYCMN